VYPKQCEIFEGLGVPKRKICFIPNGIAREYFQIYDDKAFREKFNIGKRKIITFIGRLTPHKRVEDLIRAIGKIIRKYKDLVVVIAGPDKGALYSIKNLVNELGINPYVLLLGEINEKEKHELLDSTDIFVNPSSYEAFGLAVAEAMAKGIPVISADNPGAKYLLDDGKCGLLYKTGDVEELSDKILYLITNSDAGKRIGECCRVRALEFSWERIAESIENKILKCIEKDP